MKHLLLPLIAISLLTSLAAAQERLDISLDRSAMFVPLPPEVTTVTRGPDGRAWLTIARPPSSPPLARNALQTVIRQEFREQRPQIPGMHPILFEPSEGSGRVWFSTTLPPDGRRDRISTILAYDGSDFVELPATPNYSPTIQRPPTAAAFADGPGGGHAFFAGPDRINIYDGKQWSTHKTPPGFGELPYHLFTEPDRKGIIAVPRDSINPLLRWRDGYWSQLALPDPTELARYAGHDARITSAAPRTDGIWLCFAAKGLYFLSYKDAVANQPPPPTVPELLKQLKDTKFETRELASLRLLALGPGSIEPELRKAIEANRKEESRYRFEFILANLRQGPQALRPHNQTYANATLPFVQFGKYRVRFAEMLLPLLDGSTLLSASFISEGSLPPKSTDRNRAVLIQAPDGNVGMLTQNELITWGDYHHFGYPPGIMIPAPSASNNQIWFQGHPNLRPCLLDLTTNKIIRSIPFHPIDAMLAALNDGTIFFKSDKRTYAYHPDAKDLRTIIQPSHTATTNSIGTITGDGAYWYTQSMPKTGYVIMRFDGKKNEIVTKTSTLLAIYENLTIGHTGIITNSLNTWFLVSPRGLFSADTLENLIAKHPAEVALAFVGSRPISTRNNSTLHIQADTDGNIWLLQNKKLKVLSNNQWLDNPDTEFSYLLPLGESRKILAINDKNKSMAILSIENKQIKTDPLDDSFHNANIIYSPRSEPWIAVKPNVFKRFTDAGPIQTIETNLTPIAADGEEGNELLFQENTPSIPYFFDTPTKPVKTDYSPLGFAAVLTTPIPFANLPTLYFFPLK